MAMCKIFQEYQNCCQFYYRERNGTFTGMRDALLKFTNKSETKQMLKGNIAGISLKILWKNLSSVKCYAKSNMNVCRLSLWRISRWA